MYGKDLNPATCSCKNGKYLASIIGDSGITCGEIIESVNEDAEAKLYNKTKAISTYFNELKAACETQNLYLTCILINYHSIIDSC